jgi:ABC-type transport system involved in cytochrome bd biosynthesis fused ATPase/permease subunit
VGFKYPGKEDFGLSNINVGIDMGTRVAIVGPNGAGQGRFLLDIRAYTLHLRLMSLKRKQDRIYDHEVDMFCTIHKIYMT